MSIPTLLVCDGDDAKQEILEGLIKSEPGLRYIATVSKQDGSRAVEQAVKVGTKLLWIDLDDEPVEGLNLLAETRQLHPQLPVVVSKSALDADMVRASVNLGALDFLDPQSWVNQLKIVVAKLQAGSAPAAVPAPAPAPVPAPAAAPAPAPAPSSPPAAEVDSGRRWGDLDSIPTPGATPAPAPVSNPAPAAATASTASAPAARAQEATGDIHLNVTAGARPNGNVGVIDQPQSSPTASQGGSKWGDLDAIGAPGAAAPAAPVPAPNVPPPAPPPTPAPTPSPAPQSVAPAAESGNKWGDLDAIPTPKATADIAAPASKPIHAPSEGNWGELDAIPSPGEKKPLTPQPPSSIPNPLLTGGGGGGKGLKRPAPEKAEMYNIPAVPVWMIVLIILVIAGCAYYMIAKPH